MIDVMIFAKDVTIRCSKPKTYRLKTYLGRQYAIVSIPYKGKRFEEVVYSDYWPIFFKQLVELSHGRPFSMILKGNFYTFSTTPFIPKANGKLAPPKKNGNSYHNEITVFSTAEKTAKIKAGWKANYLGCKVLGLISCDYTGRE